MEDAVIADAPLYTSHNQLIYRDDVHGEEENQEKTQVSMSMVRPKSRLNQLNLLTVSLIVLALILLAVDIGLGVYYNRLTAGQNLGSNLAKLQDAYMTALRGREEARKQLAQEMNDQQNTKWELEHEKRRIRDYEKKSDKLKTELATLKSHILLMNEGCRLCLPGWTYINSQCFYIPTADNLSGRSWQESRSFCTKQGGDLAVLDDRETHLAIFELIKQQVRPGMLYQGGFWIGTTDMEEEGDWKWINGRRVSEGFWMDGEPNNINNEDCAAIYPTNNPFKSWNDAPCGYSRRWICQMSPRGPGQT